jgi:hypothetical protein
MSSLRCLHRNKNLFSILSRVRIAPYEFTMEKLLFVVRSLKERLVNKESFFYTKTKTFENKD